MLIWISRRISENNTTKKETEFIDSNVEKNREANFRTSYRIYLTHNNNEFIRRKFFVPVSETTELWRSNLKWSIPNSDVELEQSLREKGT